MPQQQQQQQQYQFFLTAEEDARIRAIFKSRFQQCQESKGKPRPPRNSASLHNQALQQSLWADMAAGSTAEKKMTTLAVGTPYPPCVLPDHELEPMRLAELCMETHHRGRVLRLRREGPVVGGCKVRSWTVVGDEDGGDCERLEVVLHHKSRDGGEEVLEGAERFVVREPWFTVGEEGEMVVRVDHPSDLEVWRRNEVGGERAVRCKEEGNVALRDGDFVGARAAYTRGLDVVSTSSDEMVKDLYRNRALVNLRLGRYDEAKADAIAAVTGIDDEGHRSLDGKAYFRAGCAAYSLSDWFEARRLFTQQLKVVPRDRDCLTYLRRIEQRLQEQETGEYGFPRIKTNLAMSPPRLRSDVASFVKDTDIKSTHDAGRGLFARRDFQPGELILCEKAFCAVFGHLEDDEAWTTLTLDARDDCIRGFPAGLHQALMQKLLNNPSLIEQCLQLYGDYEGIGRKLVQTDNGPVIDTFQLHDIICRNAFSATSPLYEEENFANASTGLWIRASYINHSCVPNASKEIFGDLMVVRASASISAGQEVTHSYDATSDYVARQASLMRTWGFHCKCPLCKVQALETPELRQKRLDLERQAEAFLQKASPARAKRVTVARAKQLACAIAATYPDEMYKGLPKMALDGIEQWLALAKVK